METKHWVLVTGGAGYVGSHCIIKILEAGYNVVIVDNLCNATAGMEGSLNYINIKQILTNICFLLLIEVIQKIENLTNKKVEFHQANLVEKGSLQKVMKTCFK